MFNDATFLLNWNLISNQPADRDEIELFAFSNDAFFTTDLS